jgi:hypothetical protein
MAWLVPGALLAVDPQAAEGQELLQRLSKLEKWRTEALREYEGTRRYVLTGERFSQNAAMEVRVNYAYPGRKNLHIVWETGSRLLQTRVLRRVIEAEMEADSDNVRDKVRITPQNYEFRPAGTETIAGRKTFVYDVKPLNSGKFMIRGRVWVDAEDAAITRLEGEPTCATSFWVRRVHIFQQFEKVGSFWLLGSTTHRASPGRSRNSGLRITSTRKRRGALRARRCWPSRPVGKRSPMPGWTGHRRTVSAPALSWAPAWAAWNCWWSRFLS